MHLITAAVKKWLLGSGFFFHPAGTVLYGIKGALSKNHLFFQCQKGARLQLVDPFINGKGSRNVTIGQIERKDLPLDRIMKPFHLSKRPDFRGKDEASCGKAVIKRFLSDAVSCKNQPLFHPVVERKTEHSLCIAKGLIDAQLFAGLQQNFRIAISAKGHVRVLLLQLFGQRLVVIDFPIIGDDKSAGL